VLAAEQEVEGGRRDDDLRVAVEFGGVEAFDDLRYRLDRPIPVEGGASAPVHESLTRRGMIWRSYILKLPPTKNLRAMFAVVAAVDAG